MADSVFVPFGDIHAEYMKDESRLTGFAQAISFPQREEELLEALKHCQGACTIQGMRTGLNGGAVPLGGKVINMTRLNHMLGFEEIAPGQHIVKAQSGVLLKDLHAAVRGFAPGSLPFQPTEQTATLGGLFATGAKSVCGRQFNELIHRVKIISHRGEKWYSRQDAIEMAYCEDGLGAIAQLEILLQPPAPCAWSFAFFFTSREAGQAFATDSKVLHAVQALHSLDAAALALVQSRKAHSAPLKALPELSGYEAAAVVFLRGEEGELEAAAETLVDAFAALGGQEEHTWAAMDEIEEEKLITLLHGAQECALLAIAPGLHRISLDFTCEPAKAVPYLTAQATEATMPHSLTGRFSHHHLSMTLFPATAQELERAQELLRQWARGVEALGGEVALDYGIGKLKARYL